MSLLDDINAMEFDDLPDSVEELDAEIATIKKRLSDTLHKLAGKHDIPDSAGGCIPEIEQKIASTDEPGLKNQFILNTFKTQQQSNRSGRTSFLDDINAMEFDIPDSTEDIKACLEAAKKKASELLHKLAGKPGAEGKANAGSEA